MSFLSLICTCAFLSFVHIATAATAPDLPYFSGSPLCGLTTSVQRPLQLYTNTSICVLLGLYYPWELDENNNTGRWQGPWKTLAPVQIDNFTLITFNNTYYNQSLVSVNDSAPSDEERGPEVWIGVEVADGWSTRIKWVEPNYNADGDNPKDPYVLPFATIIVYVNKGAVQNVYWDRYCPTGSAYVCGNYDIGTHNNPIAAVDMDNCKTSADDTAHSADCNLKLFVTWMGTDKDNNYFTTAGLRWSQFRRYSFADAFDSAWNLLPPASSLPIPEVNSSDWNIPDFGSLGS